MPRGSRAREASEVDRRKNPRDTPRKGNHTYATPLLVQNKLASPLHRIKFGDNFRDEDWLQELLFEHPELIPFDEIEPAQSSR
jgi:hypothetical protein